MLSFADRATPGLAGELDLLVQCGGDSPFVPFANCPVPGAIVLSVVELSDQAVIVKVDSAVALTAEAQPFDRYVAFRDAGSAVGSVDDVLRVSFRVLDPLDLEISTAELTISLLSGAAIDLLDLQAHSSQVAQMVTLPSQGFAVGALFAVGQPEGPLNAGLPLIDLLVFPGLVTEPGTALLAPLALLAAGCGARRRRGHRPTESPDPAR